MDKVKNIRKLRIEKEPVCQKQHKPTSPLKAKAAHKPTPASKASLITSVRKPHLNTAKANFLSG